MEKKTLYTDDLAKAIIKSGRTKYRPSNGTEYDMFAELWCAECRKQDPLYLSCDEIGAKTFWLDTNDPNYPSEWTFDNGQPCCTAFEDKK